MHLQTISTREAVHSDGVTGVAWLPSLSSTALPSPLLTASDDASLSLLAVDSEVEDRGRVSEGMEYGVTDWAVCPTAPDTIAAACSDGLLRFFTAARSATTASASQPQSPLTIREDKRATVTSGGAAIALRWSNDGSAVVVGGEDGSVKVFSKSAMLRTTLVPSGKPVYAVAWGNDGTSVLYATGKELTIASLGSDATAGGSGGGGGGTGRSKSVTWKAHDGLCTRVDWSAVNGRIVSGGEDSKFKVWDALGRLLYASPPLPHVVTSLAWSPRGDVFVVGSYQSLRLCDASGWCVSREVMGLSPTPAISGQASSTLSSNALSTLGSGSFLALAWSPDGTMLAGGCGTGCVTVSKLIGTQCVSAGLTVTLAAPNRLSVTNTATATAPGSGSSGSPSASASATATLESEAVEELEIRDRIVTFAVGFGHIVVATPSHVALYTAPTYSTSHTIDTPKAAMRYLVLSQRHFVGVDVAGVLTVYSYDGRTLCTPKLASPLKVDSLGRGTIAVSAEVVSFVDKADGGKVIRTFDIRTGRAIASAITHHLPITHIAISQAQGGGIQERRMVFTDASQDLYISSLVKPQPFKLAAMVDSFAWNESCDMLCAITDGQCVTWLVPQAAALDTELSNQAKLSVDATVVASFGTSPSIVSFVESHAAVKRDDGSLIHATISNYAPLLHECTSGGKWNEAVRLARFVQHHALWAALAILALSAKQLDAAEVALAAIRAVDKLEWIQHVKSLALPELRNSELALYRRQVEEAESILLQSQPMLLYRAIKLNIRLSRWERALQVAQMQSAHVDTVLWYRSRFLEALHRDENLESFKAAAAANGPLNVAAIKARKASEKAREKSSGKAPATATSSARGGSGAEGKAGEDEVDIDL